MRKLIFGLLAVAGLPLTATADDIADAFKGGTVNGNLRAYQTLRDYDNRTDTSAFAFGGGLRAETATWGLAKIGAGFYTAQDMGLNSNDPNKVDTRMGDNMEVLGEAYVNFSARGNSLTAGRQKIVTPFATPLDIFLAPFTYEGVSYQYTGIKNLTVELDHVNTIKAAGSDEFVDVGIWSTQRFGVAPQATSGTTMLGLNYATPSALFKAWHYNFSELFHLQYLQADYNFQPLGAVNSFAAVQYVQQAETGDALMGAVDSETLGAQIGATIHKSKWLLGFTHVAENTQSYNNGAFLAPFSFASSPLFTNNMLQTMENIDAGQAIKLTFFYYFPSVELKLSHAIFDFTNVVDREASCVDITYNLNRHIKGLSLRYRAEWVTSKSNAVSQSDQRVQLQYAF